jgi:hypothetical protein
MSEEWRAVPGWEGEYAISSEGRVKSLARNPEGRPGVGLNLRAKILPGSINKFGYVTVALCRNNKRHYRLVHRLVLVAFVGPCPDGMEGCHYDGDPSNNALSNLRWDTRSANTYDRVRHGTHHAARKTECKNGHPFDVGNTYLAPNGTRACRTCRISAKERYLNRRMNRVAA